MRHAFMHSGYRMTLAVFFMHARVAFHFGSDQPGSVIRGVCVFFRILSNPKAVNLRWDVFQSVLDPVLAPRWPTLGPLGRLWGPF
jgi:hypothetical protein